MAATAAAPPASMTGAAVAAARPCKLVVVLVVVPVVVPVEPPEVKVEVKVVMPVDVVVVLDEDSEELVDNVPMVGLCVTTEVMSEVMRLVMVSSWAVAPKLRARRVMAVLTENCIVTD